MTETPWHFIRPNEANRYPRRIVCFDTEARIIESKQSERQSFRLAAASFDLIDRTTREPKQSETMVFWEPEHLWEWISARCKPKSRTVCFAHNIAYDIRIADALRILPKLEWELAFLTLDSNRCVARWKRKGASLLLCDLSSWLPTSLEKVADRVGMKKTPLPSQTAGETEWAEHCLTDVAITRVAALRLLRWLEDNDLGNFRLTGPAMAMGAYRHRFLPPFGLLAHREKPILDLERKAAWAGRCEVYRHGEVAGPLYEWDFRLAYLNIARTLPLPIRLRGEAETLSFANLRRLAKHRAILSEVTCHTTTPVVPANVNNGVGWPVGEFDTVLWDNELLFAASKGAEFDIRRSWVFYQWPALADWSNWLLGMLAPDGLPVDSLERLMLKDWARSLIGRFGARWPEWSKVARLPESGLELVPYVNHETGETGAYMQNGHDWFEKTGMVDAPDAMPAIMGYIMAESRTRLYKVMETAGLENIVYCDTDSVVVTADGNENLLASYPPDNDQGLIQKAKHKTGLFLGPRQIRLDTELRIAGLPKSAIQRGPRSFEAVMWEGLAEGIRRGHPNEVRIYRRAVRVRGNDRRRRHLAGGSTAPYFIAGSEDRSTEGLPVTP